MGHNYEYISELTDIPVAELKEKLKKHGSVGWKMKILKKTYGVLKETSIDEQKHMSYETRQMAIIDEKTRLMEAYEQGILDTAIKMHKEAIEIQLISKITDIPINILKEKFNINIK